MTIAFTESTVEEAALAWLEAIGWRIAHGPDIAPDMPAAERASYSEVLLSQRLRGGCGSQNPFGRSTRTYEQPMDDLAFSRH